MSLRRFRVLMEHLPVESFTSRAVARRPPHDWTITQHLLAGVHEQVQANTFVTGAVGQARRNPASKPQQLPRPRPVAAAGDHAVSSDGPRRQSGSAEIKAFFAGAGTQVGQ